MNKDFQENSDILWMLWDTEDGDEIVIKAKDYVEYCVSRPDRFWGFDVTVVKFGIPRSECESVDTDTLNQQIQEILDNRNNH